MKGNACMDIGLGVTLIPRATSRWQSRSTFGSCYSQLPAQPALHLLGPALFPSHGVFPPVGAVCELEEAGIPRHPSYRPSFVNGG